MPDKETFAVIDTETTGMEDDDELVEFASVPVVHYGGGVSSVLDGDCALAKPSVPIKLDAMAVHHITDQTLESVTDTPQDAVRKVMAQTFNGQMPLKAIVAHNARFDQKYCGGLVPFGVPWICTYKVGLTLWPEAPSHKNASLFYYNEIHCDEDHDWETFFESYQLHRALPDATITAHLFGRMLGMMSADDMIAISAKPALLPRVPFGKHYGKKWSDVDFGYLKWVLGQDFEEDVVHTVQCEMKRRSSR